MLPDGQWCCVHGPAWLEYDSRRGALYADPLCTAGVFGVRLGTLDGCAATPIDPRTIYAESFTLGACDAVRPFRLPGAPIAKPSRGTTSARRYAAMNRKMQGRYPSK